METIFWIFVLLLAAWFSGAWYLRGKDLSAFDHPTGESFGQSALPSVEHHAVAASLSGISDMLKRTPRAQHLAMLRNFMDTAFPEDPGAARITATQVNAIPAEWVIAPGVDVQRRLLYIHGGAFMLGSPKSHRRLTSKFSEVANAAVLAIDYRLMPEHPRMAGIEDCRSAYRWMLDNGPDGPGPAQAVYVAGDSAGGNLTLSLIAWVRDQRLRAPDAAVALSPATDATFGSPSLKDNIATDPMLGPLFKSLAKVPKSLLLWGTWIQNRIRPNHPLLSPALGDLSGLPAVLVHASEMEMLRDDARRYVNRAIAAGSPVTLQSWRHMVHVWHIYHPELAEGRQAFEEIGKFLRAPH